MRRTIRTEILEVPTQELEATIRAKILSVVSQLLLGKKSHIKFTERLRGNNPGIQSGTVKDTYGMHAGHIITDPDTFFSLLKKTPHKFEFDCLSIIPVVQFFTLFEMFSSLGFPPNIVFDLFENAVVSGSFSAIHTNNPDGTLTAHSPLLVSNISGRENIFPKPYSQVQVKQNLTFTNWRTYKPSVQKNKAAISKNPMIADSFHFVNTGLDSLPTYHNYDDWNGFILRSNKKLLSSNGLLLNELVSSRVKLLSAVAQQLFARLPEHGITQTEQTKFMQYQERGGLSLVVLRTNYSGLYQSLVTYLQGKK